MTKSRSLPYRKEIDGLRAIAVLPVILFHAGFSIFSGGYVGVDVFFVISGYLITGLILAEKRSGIFSIINFYERRARRILPALFLVIICCLPFAWAWMLPGELETFARSIVAISLFLSNIQFWRESGYFAAASEEKPLLHTWSLAVEEQYYLLFPMFLIMMWRFGLRRIAMALIFVAAVSLGLAEWGWRHHASAAFFLLPFRIWELLVGAILAIVLCGGGPVGRRQNELGSWLGLFLILYSIFFFDHRTPFPSLLTLMPTLGTALVIAFATPETTVNRLLRQPPLVGVGLISYSAYLWHQPLFAFARVRSFAEPGQMELFALAVGSLLLAWLSWHFVERPFRNKIRFSRQRIFHGAALASVAAIVIGLAGTNPRVLESRLPTMAAALLQPTRSDDQGCQEAASADRINKGIVCVLGAPGTKPLFVVIGDSHATRLTNALVELARDNGFSFAIIGEGWCAPLLDFGTPDPGRNQGCRAFVKASFDYVTRMNIPNVVLHAEWASYTTGYRYTDKGKTLKPVRFHFYQDPFDPIGGDNQTSFERALLATVDTFAGQNLYIVESIPEFKIHIPKTTAKLSWLMGAEPEKLERDGIGEFGVALNDYRNRNEGVFRALRLVKEKAEIIAVDDLFCGIRHYGCEFMKNGKLLYTDSNHLSLEGSRPVALRLYETITNSSQETRQAWNRTAP